MFSVRKTSIMMIVLSVTAGTGLTQGCGGKVKSAANKTGSRIYDAGNIASRRSEVPARDSAELTTNDPAMEKRQWPQSTVYLPNGATVAGPTGFAFKPREDQNKRQFYYADTGVFFLNLITMPYTLFRNPPLSEQTSSGVRFNPTFTAVPALPAGSTTVDTDLTPQQMDAPAEAPTEAPAAPSDAPASPAEAPVAPTETPAEAPAGAAEPAAPTTQP